MAKKRPTEIFSIDALDGIVRQILRERGTIDLADFNIPTYSIPEDYSTHTLTGLDSSIHASQLRGAIEPAAQEAEAAGFGSGLFTAVYEAALNAHQHGNEGNPEKRIIIAYKLDKCAEFVIVDSGGRINAELASYILAHRQTNKLPNFYDFAACERSGQNLGTGTQFMHIYADDVKYFKHKDGGLAVVLRFVKEQD